MMACLDAIEMAMIGIGAFVLFLMFLIKNIGGN